MWITSDIRSRMKKKKKDGKEKSKENMERMRIEEWKGKK